MAGNQRIRFETAAAREFDSGPVRLPFVDASSTDSLRDTYIQNRVSQMLKDEAAHRNARRRMELNQKWEHVRTTHPILLFVSSAVASSTLFLAGYLLLH